MEFQWHTIKEPIAKALAMPHPVLHVLIGGIAFFAMAWLLRSSRYGLVYAWFFVLTIELINEIGDAYDWIK